MKIYLVGGAVRDQLLGIPYTEKDWVVVGSSPEEMLRLGYRPVGKDFPVFLHPETHEEYALARTERKTGKGYTQFEFHTSPEVTLEEDLSRRDLTINAIALTESGEIIDPYSGQKDLQARLFRHVSPAFIEDPVRILRVARLMARLASLGFQVAPETYQLMQEMVKNGEVDALVPNRVWAEWDKALGEVEPQRFFEILEKCGALEKLFPEIFSSKIECNHISFPLGCNIRLLRFASIMLSLDVNQIKSFCKRYPIPVAYKELALISHKVQKEFQQEKLSPEIILDILEKTDAYRRQERFSQVLEIFQESPQYSVIQKAFESTRDISAEIYIQQGYSGKAVGEKIKEERLRLIKKQPGRKASH